MSSKNQNTDGHEVLARLINTVHAMSSHATVGRTLIAAGEVWDALESIQEGVPVEVNTELTLGVRHGDREYEEGLFLSIRVNELEIVLDRMVTTYSRELGSDHETDTLARLTLSESLDCDGVEDWLDMVEELLLEPESTLSASRDHI